LGSDIRSDVCLTFDATLGCADGRAIHAAPEGEATMGRIGLATARSKRAVALQTSEWPAAGSMDTELSLSWPTARTALG
jgi:hypothetical protein